MKVKCAHCNKSFIRKHPNAKYCSKACARKAIRVQQKFRQIMHRKCGLTKEMLCKWCGKVFVRNKCERYCSKDCSGRSLASAANKASLAYYRAVQSPENKARTATYHSLTDEEKDLELEQLRSSIMRENNG